MQGHLPRPQGHEDARHAARDLIEDARASLEPFGENAAALRWIADYMVQRES